MKLLAGLVVAAVVCTGSVAHAAPEFVRLSYASAATDTEIAITWNTPADVGTTVEYGLAPGSLTMSETGTSFQATGALGYIHEVTLTGLTPDTTYYYRAGDAADGFSIEHTFTTGPAQHPECGEVTFAYLGDNRPDPTFGGGENYDAILGELFAHAPEFILTGGDMVEDGDDIGQWRTMLGYTEDVFNTRPFMPTLGNHDDGPVEGDGAHYNDVFALPRAMGTGGSGTEDYYYFTYGNAIFVSLSTETFTGGATAFADQAAWLDEVLTANPKRWKIVYYHKPNYTYEVFFSISHPPNEEGQNAALVAVLDEHHVDVVITSHNHWYERYEPSACGTMGSPGSDDPCSVGADNYEDGTVYVVSGGAGAFTIPGFLCGSPSGRATCSGDHHYLLFEVTNDSLQMETWSAPPEASDIIDVITITKPTADCAAPTNPDAGPGPGIDSGPGGTIDGGDPLGDPDGGDPGADGEDSGGCCRVAGDDTPPAGALVLALAVGLVVLRRRRRRR
jgi:MYXO-CTERM domain-containing protein